jgi:hypothetical protein
VKVKRSILIVTDGSEKTVKMAAEISAALKGNRVSVKSAPEFKGNDILPAEVIFLGCEKPEPPSFTYLSDLLQHINLAGRPGGVFSPGPIQAVQDLANLVKDSEAALNPDFFCAGTKKNIAGWAQNIIAEAV